MNIEQLRAAYNDAVTKMRSAAQAVENAPEDADLDALQRDLDDSIEASERAKESLESAEERQRALDNLQPVAVETDPEGRTGSAGGGLRVLNDEAIYRPDVERSFFGDLYRSQLRNDSEATERIERHNAQARDVTTGAGADGVLPPVYLTEHFADLPREGRPVADLFGGHPLPDKGMTITIPRMATGATVAAQATEGGNVSETDADTDSIDVPVRTIAGLQDMTRQAIDRSDPAFDRLVMMDLVAAHDEEIDRQVIAEDASSGTHDGLLNVTGLVAVTYTDASPTAEELLPKAHDALQQMWAAIFRNATHVIMHPRRAAWLAAATTANAPLFPQPQFVDGQRGGQNGGFISSFAGLPVVIDANVPTNLGTGTDEDRVIFVNAGQSPLFEGPLNMAVETGPGSQGLKVRVVAYSYSAFASNRRPKSIAVISGTGLVAPTF